MTISPEEAKRLAEELLDETEPQDPQSAGPIGVGSQIGRYRIESLIATGGMGAVYRAKHEHPSRIVALKVVRPELLSSAAVRRFRHETELLGRLQHPGIAQIFEAGSVHTNLGEQPFFAMEFIEGQPLLEFADGAKLGTRARLELFLKVCDAVEHAHRKGVIHRDLKPGNVLVTAEGEPKILDFGVAKATDADILTTTLRTDVGQLVGTLPYMSPEQASGDAADLDTRSDVYSLGVLLYHLLSGRLPYEVKKSAIAEALRAIQEEDPAPLSSIDKTLRGDIETIVGKALEKDRDRRYQGASDFAGDIRRYLADETITARPASAWYQFSKFSKRNRGVVVAGCLLAASLVLGIAGTTGGMLWAMDQKTRAETAEGATKLELARVTEVKRLITEMISRVSPQEAGGMDTALLKKILDDTADRLTNGEIEDALIRAELHGIVGEVYVKLGLFGDAEHHLPIALDIQTRLLGKEHLSTLIAMHSMAILHQNQGRLAEAEPLYLETIEIRSRLLGEEHSNTLGAVNNLASLYREQARYAEAEPLLLESLEIRKRVHGEDHPDTLASMSSLAVLFDVQGRFGEAEPLYRKALESKKQVLGEEHPDTLISMGNLAVMYKDMGRYAEAETLYAKTLSIRERVLGVEHPRTLTSLVNMATLYATLGRYSEAEPLHVRALHARQRLLGDEHPDTLGSMNNLAIMYKSQGRFAEAEPLYLKTLEIRQRLLGDEHPDTLDSLNNLAGLYFSQGRIREAEPLWVATLDARKRVLGLEHPDTLGSMNNLAIVYNDQGRYSEAEPLYLETLAIKRRVLGEEHMGTMGTIASLGILYKETGRLEDAVEMLEMSLSVFRRDLSIRHPWTRFAMDDLADAYFELGRHDDAATLFGELLGFVTAAAEAPNAIASTLNDAARALLTNRIDKLCDPRRALGLAEQACRKEEAVGGGDLWMYLDTLALAQHRTGDFAKAVETQKRASALVPENADDATREEFATNLRTYEAALP